MVAINFQGKTTSTKLAAQKLERLTKDFKFEPCGLPTNIKEEFKNIANVKIKTGPITDSFIKQKTIK